MSSHDSTVAPPLLRGYLHLVGAMLAPFALMHLLYVANSPSAMVGALVFGVSLILLYATSAAYHLVRWSAALRPLVRRIDHAMIFVFIAGTYTPFTLTLMSRELGVSVMSVVWALAGTGILLKLVAFRTPHWLSVGLYLTMGWFGVVPAIMVAAIVPVEVLILPFMAGVLGSIGAAIYLTRWPDPFPRVFGYHEVFHALVLAATTLLYLVLALYVLTS